jgi:hypothetical protein
MRWVIAFLYIWSAPSWAQEKGAPYVLHLELGASMGSDEVGIRVNQSIKTLHAVQFHPNHLFGFILGADSYPLLTVVPFGVGWRGVLDPLQKTSWMAGMDLGYGSTVLEKKMESEWNNLSWFEGGLMAHPTVGLRIKNKRNSAWSFLMGYKHQSSRFYQGLPSANTTVQTPSLSNPADWIYLRKDQITYRNLTVAVGLIFL